MRSVLLSSNSTLNERDPSVEIVALDGSAVELELSFRVADIAAAGKAKAKYWI